MMECNDKNYDQSELIENEKQIERDQSNNSENVKDVKDDQMTDTKDDQEKVKSKNKKPIKIDDEKRGIVYLSYIPPGLNVSVIRQIFSQFGDVERIYLEPDKSVKSQKNHSNKKKHKVNYIEGWVEFRKKKIAKKIAEMLNGTQIGGKRRTRFHDCIWSIKYLKKFKWSHLVEQMAYEKAMREQRMRFEIGQAKKETNFYTNMVEKSKRMKRINDNDNKSTMRYYKQRLTDEEIRKRKKQLNNEVDMELLSKIFS